MMEKSDRAVSPTPPNNSTFGGSLANLYQLKLLILRESSGLCMKKCRVAVTGLPCWGR